MTKARKAVAALARVRDLHQPVDTEFVRGPYPDRGETGTITYTLMCCSHCEVGGMGMPAHWPCDTIRAIEGETT